MTPDSIRVLARKAKLTNDATFVGNQVILDLRKKVTQMMIQKFWHDVNPLTEFKETWDIARNSFPYLDAMMTTKEEISITSYNKAKEHICKYIKISQLMCDKILGYVGKFDHKSVQKNDLLFLFIRPDNRAFGEEVIEPVEHAVITNTCRYVDAHYTYTEN